MLVDMILHVNYLFLISLRGNSLRDDGIGDMMLAVENSHLKELRYAS